MRFSTPGLKSLIEGVQGEKLHNPFFPPCEDERIYSVGSGVNPGLNRQSCDNGAKSRKKSHESFLPSLFRAFVIRKYPAAPRKR
ncbi:hypothetical protein, partial [Aminivibrio pyruvatiphilus]|uniref:hypothetical protein n=1 Tax=Aminivibrio pyruvatiphilus TaxID=1005740 RepID=UPI001AB03112